MARTDTSRTGLSGISPASPMPMTLAAVRDRLDAVAGLSAGQRADLRSALNVVGRALGRPLEAIPSSPKMLRDALDKVGPASAGIGQQSWANMRSRLNRALDLAGVPVMRSRRTAFLTPQWQDYADRLPDIRFRAALSRFMGYCSAQDIAPDAVTAGTFTRFRESVELQSLRRRPQDGYRETVKAWNRARLEFPAWPDVAVEVPDLRNRYTLDWADFPASLKADIDAMVADCTGSDIVSMKAPRGIQPNSAQNRVTHIQRLVSGYVHRGGDPAALRNLADVVDPEIVTEGMRFHLKRAGGTPTSHHDAIMIAVCTIARQWVGVPDEQLEALKRLRRSLAVEPKGMKEKTRLLLRQFDDPVRLALLLNRPGEIIRAIAAQDRITRSDAATAAAALGAAILLECPMRPKNLASLDLDRHISRIGHNRGTGATLIFSEEEVKNGVELMMPLSPATTELLDLYIRRMRPVLLQTESTFLFPARDGGSLAPAYLSDRIAGLTQAKIGVRITAHKFRHLAGYLYLKRNPGRHEVVRRLLGHKDIATTVAFYAPLDQDEAFRHYDDLLDELRREAEDTALPRRRS